MGLNFTSTKPSLRLVSFLRQTGYVASPDCLSTFGLLGAESSCSMVHLASPLPVLVAVQPGGASPGLASSKLMVCACAVTANRPVVNASFIMVFMVCLLCAFIRLLIWILSTSFRVQCCRAGHSYRSASIGSSREA